MRVRAFPPFAFRHLLLTDKTSLAFGSPGPAQEHNVHNSIVKDKEAVSEIPKDLKRSKPVFALAAPEARGPDILPFCPLRIAVCRESGPPSPTRYLSLPAACLAVEKGHFVPIFRHIFSRRNAVGLKQKMPRSTKVRILEQKVF